MLVSAVDTDNRDRRVIKASFPHGRDPDSEAISMPESSAFSAAADQLFPGFMVRGP